MASWPTDAEVVENARAAYAEVRAQMDHQIRNADAIDTKATAVITVIGVLAALVAPRLNMDDGLRQWSAAAALALAFGVLACCFLAIRPQANFAFGADPDDLLRDRVAEKYPPAAYWLGVVNGLIAARRQNVIALDRKADWYARALLSLGALLVGIGWLIFIGGLA